MGVDMGVDMGLDMGLGIWGWIWLCQRGKQIFLHAPRNGGILGWIWGYRYRYRVGPRSGFIPGGWSPRREV